MAITPQDFIEQIIRPNLAELDTRFGDKRLAFNTVNAIDALPAYIYVWCQMHMPSAVASFSDDSAYRDYLAKRDRDFAVIRDLAKAQKHAKLTRGTPQYVTSAGAVDIVSLGFDEGKWDELRWDSPPQVIVRTNDANISVVEALARRALTFLENEMARVGIL